MKIGDNLSEAIVNAVGIAAGDRFRAGHGFDGAGRRAVGILVEIDVNGAFGDIAVAVSSGDILNELRRNHGSGERRAEGAPELAARKLASRRVFGHGNLLIDWRDYPPDGGKAQAARRGEGAESGLTRGTQRPKIEM